MSKRKQKSRNQTRADWVRRRQNIARGMRIAMYEINQALAPRGLTLSFPADFVPHTVAIAEGGRTNASAADVTAAAFANIRREIQRNAFVVLPLR